MREGALVPEAVCFSVVLGLWNPAVCPHVGDRVIALRVAAHVYSASAESVPPVADKAPIRGKP